MSSVYINGYGLCLEEITDAEKLLEVVDCKKKVENNCVPSIEILGMQRKYRRMDRFSLLIEQAMTQLFAEEQVETSLIKSFQNGSILNTSFGCLDTNMKFISEILKNDINQISPIQFAHTVYNAGLGHMCQNYKFRGQSTMVISSNYIFIAMQMLKKNKVKNCYAGGAEIYIKELCEYLMHKCVKFTECACILKLCSEAKKESIGEIIDFSECNFGGHPYMENEEIIKEKLYQNVNMIFDNNNITANDVDLIVASSLYGSRYKEEEEVLEDIFKQKKIVPITRYIGETLGASLGVSILYAAKELKKINKRYSLVNNYDIGGNFQTYLVGLVK